MTENHTKMNKRTFNDARKMVKKSVPRKEASLEKIEEEYTKKYIRKFYKEIVHVIRGFQAPQLFMEDRFGNLIGDEDEKKAR